MTVSPRTGRASAALLYVRAARPGQPAADARGGRRRAPPAEGSPLGRMTIEKQFHGDLEATSKGEMLTVGTAIKNTAVYVAVERV